MINNNAICNDILLYYMDHVASMAIFFVEKQNTWKEKKNTHGSIDKNGIPAGCIDRIIFILRCTVAPWFCRRLVNGGNYRQFSWSHELRVPMFVLLHFILVFMRTKPKLYNLCDSQIFCCAINPIRKWVKINGGLWSGYGITVKRKWIDGQNTEFSISESWWIALFSFEDTFCIGPVCHRFFLFFYSSVQYESNIATDRD